MTTVSITTAQHSVTVRAPAKINVHLEVGAVRDDGFHPLATVYQAIGIYDDVTVSEADEWSLEVKAHERIDVTEVPTDDGNLALRAARLIAEHHGEERRAAIGIDKGIPVAGGLAGGSADAAATLLALDRLWDLQTSDDDLLALAARLGSDVPFALIGGTATGHGRGEVVEPVDDRGAWWWVVAESDIGLSTPAVYAELDRLGHAVPDPVVPAAVIDALASGDPRALAGVLSNGLTEAALHLRPDLRAVLDAGVESGALAGLLSGSGPTCLFLCEDSAHAVVVRHALADAGIARTSSAPGPVAGAHPVSYA